MIEQFNKFQLEKNNNTTEDANNEQQQNDVGGPINGQEIVNN